MSNSHPLGVVVRGSESETQLQVGDFFCQFSAPGLNHLRSYLGTTLKHAAIDIRRQNLTWECFEC